MHICENFKNIVIKICIEHHANANRYIINERNCWKNRTLKNGDFGDVIDLWGLLRKNKLWCLHDVNHIKSWKYNRKN